MRPEGTGVSQSPHPGSFIGNPFSTRHVASARVAARDEYGRPRDVADLASGRRWTYRELHAAVNRIAAWIVFVNRRRRS